MDANLHNDLKLAVIYVAIGLKENIPKEVKKADMTRFHQKETTKQLAAAEK